MRFVLNLPEKAQFRRHSARFVSGDVKSSTKRQLELSSNVGQGLVTGGPDCRSTSHSYVTHLVVRSNPRTKASASVPSLAALRWHRNCSMNQSINSRPRTIRLLQQLLPCSPQGARQRHAVSLDPRPIWCAVSLRHLADKARSSASEIQRLREPRHLTTASAIMRTQIKAKSRHGSKGEAEVRHAVPPRKPRRTTESPRRKAATLGPSKHATKPTDRRPPWSQGDSTRKAARASFQRRMAYQKQVADTIWKDTPRRARVKRNGPYTGTYLTIGTACLPITPFCPLTEHVGSPSTFQVLVNHIRLGNDQARHTCRVLATTTRKSVRSGPTLCRALLPALDSRSAIPLSPPGTSCRGSWISATGWCRRLSNKWHVGWQCRPFSRVRKVRGCHPGLRPTVRGHCVGVECALFVLC